MAHSSFRVLRPALPVSRAAARAQNQDLFVSNADNNTISRFAAIGPSTFSTTATTLSAPSPSQPIGLASDARGNLYAENFNTGNTSESAFNPLTGLFGPAQTIGTGQTGGSGYLAVGPSVSPAVPEASTMVSLGLLLTLTADAEGGVTAARKKEGKA